MARVKKNKVARKTAKTKTTTSAAKSPEEKVQVAKTTAQWQNVFEQLKLGESYTSLVLGAAVVIGLALFFFAVLRNGGMRSNNASVNQSASPTTAVTQSRTYILKDGEGLWDVAVRFYGDGYRWTDIAKANNLENNPDNLNPGTKLIIPNTK